MSRAQPKSSPMDRHARSIAAAMAKGRPPALTPDLDLYLESSPREIFVAFEGVARHMPPGGNDETLALGYLFLLQQQVRESAIESTTGRQCVRVNSAFGALSNRAMPSPQAEMCREKAAEAKRSAARAPHPSIKTLFEEVASSWLRLAEQTEWIERRASEPRDEGVSN
jgi:hypothetical protein